MSDTTAAEQDFLDEFGEVIAPPSAEDIEDLRTHNLGAAMRLAARLGRPLEDWEYDIFRRIPQDTVYEIVDLGNGRCGIAA